MQRNLPAISRLPRAVFARVESLSAGSWTDSHSHPWAQFSYTISGVLEIRSAQGSFVAPPQRGVWIPAGIEHQVLSATAAEMRSLYIDSLTAQAAGLDRPERVGCRVLDVTPLARELILAVVALPEEYAETGPQGRLVAVLLDQLAALPEAGLSLPLPADERLARVCAQLQNRPDDQRSEAQWAQDAGMSERTMARLFRKETGLSFGEWRLRMRLLAALAGLQRGASVTTVALDCGYDSPSAFISAFRKRFGRTPGQYFR